jgi:hypothetical protein
MENQAINLNEIIKRINRNNEIAKDTVLNIRCILRYKNISARKYYPCGLKLND